MLAQPDGGDGTPAMTMLRFERRDAVEARLLDGELSGDRQQDVGHYADVVAPLGEGAGHANLADSVEGGLEFWLFPLLFVGGDPAGPDNQRNQWVGAFELLEESVGILARAIEVGDN